MPTAEPLLVFDGDCAFCSTWVERGRRMLPVFPPAEPWQWLDLDELGLTREDVIHFAWYLEGERRWRGHGAVAGVLLRQRGFGWRFLGNLLLTPPFSWGAALAYRFVARFRHRLPGGTPACALEHGAQAVSGLRRDASADARPGRRSTSI